MTSRVAKAPMEFVVKLQCSGSVDREKFAQAILQEIRRHPLLQSNAEIGPSHRQSHWRAALEPVPQINWIEEAFSPEQGFPEGFTPIDLKREIGLRFYGWHCDAQSNPNVVMKFVFHHACCDGKAGLDFVQQTLVKYGSLCEGDSGDSDVDSSNVDSKAEVSSDVISDRDTQARQSLSPVDRLRRSILVRPKRVAKFLFQRPVQLDFGVAKSKNIDAENLYDAPPHQCTFSFDQKATKALGEFSKSRNSTTNLVLAKELFHALNENIDEPGDSDNRARFRLMIPYSLREDRQHQVQVANCVSIVYLEATRRAIAQDCEKEGALLSELGRQMAHIRRWQMQYSWIESIESYAKYWPLIKNFKRKKTSADRQRAGLTIATAAMTNLGQAFKNQRWAGTGGKIKVGSLEVKSVHVAVPCTEKLNTNFSVNFYRDRLTLDIIYLPSLVTREVAQSILDSWTRRIAALV